METEKPPPKQEMNWILVSWYIHLHALGAYGLWLLLVDAKWMTVLFLFAIVMVTVLGLTAGAHRLWAHRTYEASWQARLFLSLVHTLAGVGPIHNWVLSHRIHHKFFGTDKDPHNHKKGFWYSHLYSNLMMAHPEQEELEKSIDMRDIDSDGFLWIQQKFYWLLFIIFGLLLPVNTPAEYWGESLKNSVFILGFLRLAICANIAWLINSAIYIWGLTPEDKFPTDDNSVFIVKKSYWPNYHYLVPWDWKTGEFGNYDNGYSTFLIKIGYEFGIVNSMKTASSEDVRDALFKATSKKSTIEKALADIEEIANDGAMKLKLHFHH